MAKTNRYFLAALFLVLVSSFTKAQSKQTLEDQGYDALNSHQYVKAYEIFDKLHSRYPKEIDYQFKLGICCLNYAEKKDRAIEIFKDMKTKYKTLEVEVYLGKAYHRNYKFDEGIKTLEPLVEILTKSTRKEDKALLDDVTLTINNCKSGLYLMQNKVFADIQNIGAPINSNELEGVPIITADESEMIFTYVGFKSMGGKLNESLQSDPVNGLFRSDIYKATRDATGTKWNKPEPMKTLNTLGEDAAIAMSPSGQTLFTFLSSNTNPGDIMVSKLVGNEFTAPVALNGNINTVDYWEGSCSISADGKFLYFASERPEGLGGRDIWVSENIDGDWGPAVNCGPNINTQYDEDAPFIHPDGITLFFSSKGHQSIGGYDIMFSIKEGNEWTKPKSMGIPLNTTEDDSYYVINSKGDKGYFSSTRTDRGGMGEQDIYMVTPGILGEKPVVALIKGTVYGDDRPVEGKIEVVKIAQKENIGPFTSNNKTGKYLMALSPGFVYRIKVSAEGYDSIEEDLDIESLSGYMEQSKDFYLYTQAYAAASSPPKQSGVKTVMTVQPPPPKAKEVKQPDVATTTPETPKEEAKAPESTSNTETPAVAETKNTSGETTKSNVTENDTPAEEPSIAATESKPEKKNDKRKNSNTNEKSNSSSGMPCGGAVPDLGPVKGKSLNDYSNYRKLMELAGSYCASNVVFKVQVGAYRNPGNFNTSALSSLGKVESDSYPDGITRFTQKQFNTLKEAEAHRQKAISKGQKDAWIVAFVDGKRYTLEDFIMIDFASGPAN
ncbi:MAG: PD40 domain-containing protein [Bacteroidia bacterium]|nr:PD40 domain-containing protein [Bacteroidia bacterium]